MDLEPDRAAGRRTTATVIGWVPAKLLMALLMFFQAGLVVRFLGAKELAGFRRSRPYSNREMRFFMLAWNAIALISMPWMWSQASLLHIR